MRRIAGFFIAVMVVLFVWYLWNPTGDAKGNASATATDDPEVGIVNGRETKTVAAPENLTLKTAPPEDRSATPVTVPAVPIVEPPFNPNAIARGLDAAPGAIICDNFDLVGVLYTGYNTAFNDRLLDKLTKGQSSLIHGQPAPVPDPTEYGCSLLPPGTPMEVVNPNGLPQIKAKRPDGVWISGVTIPAMFSLRAETR